MMNLQVFKLANVIAVFKKGSKNLKYNYRLINILKNTPKVYKKQNWRIYGSLFLQISMWF